MHAQFSMKLVRYCRESYCKVVTGEMVLMEGSDQTVGPDVTATVSWMSLILYVIWTLHVWVLVVQIVIYNIIPLVLFSFCRVTFHPTHPLATADL